MAAISRLAWLVVNLSRIEIIIDAKPADIRCMILKLRKMSLNIVHCAIQLLISGNSGSKNMRTIDMIRGHYYLTICILSDYFEMLKNLSFMQLVKV